MLWIVVAVVAVIALPIAIGSVLPRAHLAARRATFAKPPDAVWAAMVELAAATDLPTAIDIDDRPTRYVTRIADDKLPFGGRWIYELEPVGGGTRLTITEDGFVKNPIFRLVTALAPNATKNRFLANLARRLEVTTTVEPAEPSSLILKPRAAPTP